MTKPLNQICRVLKYPKDTNTGFVAAVYGVRYPVEVAAISARAATCFGTPT